MRTTLGLLVISIALPCSVPTFGRDVTVVYRNPETPSESMFWVVEWPSFVFMPGAPLRMSYQRSQALSGLVGQVSSRTTVTTRSLGGDLDCVDIGRPVYVAGTDPHNLDADDDGIGCE